MAIPKYWVSPTSSVFSSSSNWSLTSGGPGGATVPDASSAVIFNSHGLGPCIIDNAIDVNSLSLNSGYTGYVDQSYNPIIVENSASFGDGTFLNKGDTTVKGSIDIAGSSFINVGNITVYGGLTSSVPNLFQDLGEGTVKFLASNQDIDASGIIFNNFEIDSTAKDCYISLNNPITVNSTLTLNSGLLINGSDGTISAFGDVSCGMNFGAFNPNHNAHIKVCGKDNQYLSTGGVLPYLTTTKPVSATTIVPHQTPMNVFGHAVAMSEDGKYQLIASYRNPSASGYLYTSEDYGSTWKTNVSAPRNFWYTCAMSADGKYQYAAYGRENAPPIAGIYRSANFGKTWSQLISGPVSGFHRWQSICVSDTGQYIAACDYTDGLYYSNDWGLSWFVSNAPGSGWANVFCSPNGQTLYATKDTEFIYKSTDAGATWVTLPGSNLSGVAARWGKISASDSGQYISVAAAALQTVDAFTAFSSIYVSSDYGVTFAPELKIVTDHQTNISFSGNTISRTSGSFISEGFLSGMQIYIAGSVSNNSTNKIIQTVTATTLVLTSAVTSESSGATVTIGLNWFGVKLSPDGSRQRAWQILVSGNFWDSSNYGLAWVQDTSQPVHQWWDTAVSADGSHVTSVARTSTIDVRKLVPMVTAYGTTPIYVNGDFILSDGTFNTNGLDIIAIGNAASTIQVESDNIQDTFDSTGAGEFWINSF